MKEEVTTTVSIDTVTGQEVTMTNDSEFLEENQVVIDVIEQMVDQTIFESTEEVSVVEAIISKSETKVHMTIVVESETNPTENHIIIAVEDTQSG